MIRQNIHKYLSSVAMTGFSVRSFESDLQTVYIIRFFSNKAKLMFIKKSVEMKINSKSFI